MTNDPGMLGESGFDKRLSDNVRRLDEQSGYVQDLLSEKIDHLRSVMMGNDKRYEQRFEAQESANKYAQEKANEFRGALDDVGRKQITRTEAEQSFKATNDKIDATNKSLNEKIVMLQGRMDRSDGRTTIADPMTDQLIKEVQALRMSQSAISGEKSGKLSQQQFLFALLAAAVMIFSIVMALRK